VTEEGDDDSLSFGADDVPRPVWLRFESELEVRTLWTYPDDWRGLSSAQLEALCSRASTIIARFPRAATSSAVPRKADQQQPLAWRPARK